MSSQITTCHNISNPSKVSLPSGFFHRPIDPTWECSRVDPKSHSFKVKVFDIFDLFVKLHRCRRCRYLWEPRCVVRDFTDLLALNKTEFLDMSDQATSNAKRFQVDFVHRSRNLQYLFKDILAQFAALKECFHFGAVDKLIAFPAELSKKLSVICRFLLRKARSQSRFGDLSTLAPSSHGKGAKVQLLGSWLELHFLLHTVNLYRTVRIPKSHVFYLWNTIEAIELCRVSSHVFQFWIDPLSMDLGYWPMRC